jgi:hypothetical protein
MDDRFLHVARREPRPEFAADLHDRLSRQPPVGPPRRRLMFRPAPALAAAALVALVAALIAFPSLRAVAQEFLDMFRVRDFAAVGFDQARLDKLQNLDQNRAFMVFDREEQIPTPAPPQIFSTPQAAGAAAGIEVRTPGYVPGGFALDTVAVQQECEAHLTVNESKLRALLDALDLRDVEIPVGLAGQTVTVKKPPVVVQLYRRGTLELALVQAKSPEVSLPPGVDLERLGEIGLRILGLDAGEARRTAQGIDWHSTLVVPVPLNASTFRRVTVHGNPGLLITTTGELGPSHPRRREGTVLLWAEPDRVFGLASGLGGPDLIQVAESVR